MMGSAPEPGVVFTDRLRLSKPSPADVDELYAIQSDPRLWTHHPTLRTTELAQTRRWVAARIAWFDRDGLGTWVVRLKTTGELIGHAGCWLNEGAFWNLGYRFGADHHGKGYATEAAAAAVEQAKKLRPELPVVAYLLQHNHASAAVAERVGLALQGHAADDSHPDPHATRLVYADRDLTESELSTVFTLG